MRRTTATSTSSSTTFLRRLVLPCLAAITMPSLSLFSFCALVFKSTTINQPVFNSGRYYGYDSRGASTSDDDRSYYRRRRSSTTSSSTTINSRASSRSPVEAIIHHLDSACIVLHAAGEAADDNNDNDAPSSSSSSSSSAAKIPLDDIIIDDNIGRRLVAAPTERAEILIFNNNKKNSIDATTTTTTTNQQPTAASSSTLGATTERTAAAAAATNTVNERLLAEIQASLDKQTTKRSSSTSNTENASNTARDYFREFRYYDAATDEERRRAIEEARNLNGVDPLACLGGAAFAWACAGGLWALTVRLVAFFASHPLEEDAVYFVRRVADVVRNVVVGLFSLASGFFGVVGVGIFLLGVRVGYGVLTGELDPTPTIEKKRMMESGGGGEEFVLPNAWELMMGKTKRRR